MGLGHNAPLLSLWRCDDFSRVIVKDNDSRFSVLPVEGITKWFSDNMEEDHSFSGSDDDYVNLSMELRSGNLWYMCLQSKGKMEFLGRWIIPSRVEVAS